MKPHAGAEAEGGTCLNMVLEIFAIQSYDTVAT